MKSFSQRFFAAKAPEKNLQVERLKRLVSLALQYRASDIHLEPVADGLRVRFRIDGILRDIQTLPLEVSRKTIMALKVMSNIDIAENRRPQDGRIGQEYQNYSFKNNPHFSNLDMRVSTLPCLGGEKAVIRLFPRENPFSRLENLGFSDRTLAVYKTWLKQPQGLIIITGPTGSGKSSTLHTSLQTLATPEVNIVTVEDPIEYVSVNITQTQVNKRAGMTFASGLRAILRQDPDIIMVGEVRDEETAQTVVQSALTGHLVLTTMHTRDTVSAIPRLKDLGTDPGLISDLLLGIVAQRLVRRVCPHCAQPSPPTPEDLSLLGLAAENANPQAWRRGEGCDRCFQSGYLGREAIVELLHVDERVRRIIHHGTVEELYEDLKQIEFPSFRMAALEKLTAGVTTLEEVLRVLPQHLLSDPDLSVT